MRCATGSGSPTRTARDPLPARGLRTQLSAPLTVSCTATTGQRSTILSRPLAPLEVGLT